MTQPLRRAHLWIWLTLTLVLAALFVAGLADRRLGAPENPDFNWEKYK